MRKHKLTPRKSLVTRQTKGNTKPTQLQIFYTFLQTQVATASMVAAATGVPQKNITRFKRRLEIAGRLWEVTRTRCQLTGCRASYLTTDPAKAPNSTFQLSLF